MRGMADPSELVRFLRAYRRFLEHAADAAAVPAEELIRMKESEAFFFLGSETPARAQATESLAAVKARADRLGDQETLRYALGLILENIARSFEIRQGDSARVETILALEAEVKKLRQGGPQVVFVDDETPLFFRPDREVLLLVLGSLSRRYLRQLAALGEMDMGEGPGTQDDPALAIAAIYERQQLRGKRRKNVSSSTRRRWAEVALPSPESLDASQIDKLSAKLSRALEASLATLAPEGPPGGAWGWTARDLARAWSRDLGLSIVATRVLARAFFQWLHEDCRNVFRFAWGSVHLIEKRRLVIEESDDEREPAPLPLRGTLVELFPHP